MRLSDYDYHLPEELIAQEPLQERSASKLLWLHRHSGSSEHFHFRDVVRILEPGDLLVLNDTRVSARRLLGQKTTGAAVEFLLLKNLGSRRYEAIVKPGKRLQPGAKVSFEGGLEAVVRENLSEGLKIVSFNQEVGNAGSVPLPPYISHELRDEERYQTVYGSHPGSAAAPTAGLHFTASLLDDLEMIGVGLAYVTLDVGIDTFRPVQTEILDEHKMHGEVCSVPEETARKIKECKGRVIAVGTTTVRTLESFAEGPRNVKSGSMTTLIFIQPGYQFNVIDGMFTNFHLPKTTMLIMLSALVNRSRLLEAYQEALEHRYRFLSFGDSMLIL